MEQDKGIGDIRFVHMLLDLKRRYPERVQLIIGNRDCNKLRLMAELSDEAMQDEKIKHDTSFPYWVEEAKRVTPAMYLEKEGVEDNRVNRLKWMLKETMGSGGAFERRQRELMILRGGETVSDEDVVRSYMLEADPDASRDDRFMLQYLEQGVLAHVSGSTLFVHGGLSARNVGMVPGQEAQQQDVRAWVEALNAWAQGEVEAFKENPQKGKNSKERAGHGLMDYGVPKGNDDRSVIFTKHLVDGNAVPLAKEVVSFLKRSKITTVVVGHIPHGDCPTVIRTEGVTVVMTDTSYSEMGHKSEWGEDNRGEAVSEVLVYQDGRVEVHGVRSSGQEVEYVLPAGKRARESLVGEPLKDGRWVKAKLKGGADGGKFLTCKGEGFTVKVEVQSAEEVKAALLTPL